MKVARLGVALCGAWLLGACGGGGGTGPSQSDVVGVWQLSKCEYVSTQGMGTVDLITGGGTGTVQFTADDSIKISVSPPSGPAVTFSGTYQISGLDLMKVTPAGVTWYWAFDMKLSGQSLQLTNGSAQYDFNQDGTPDPASWNLYMHR